MTLCEPVEAKFTRTALLGVGAAKLRESVRVEPADKAAVAVSCTEAPPADGEVNAGDDLALRAESDTQKLDRAPVPPRREARELPARLQRPSTVTLREPVSARLEALKLETTAKSVETAMVKEARALQVVAVTAMRGVVLDGCLQRTVEMETQATATQAVGPVRAPRVGFTRPKLTPCMVTLTEAVAGTFRRTAEVTKIWSNERAWETVERESKTVTVADLALLWPNDDLQATALSADQREITAELPDTLPVGVASAVPRALPTMVKLADPEAARLEAEDMTMLPKICTMSSVKARVICAQFLDLSTVRMAAVGTAGAIREAEGLTETEVREFHQVAEPPVRPSLTVAEG